MMLYCGLEKVNKRVELDKFYKTLFVSITITKTVTFCQTWNLPSDGGVCFWTLLPEVSEEPFSLSFKTFCCRFLWTKHEINTMFSSSSIVPQTETLTITIKGISPWSSKERIICSREPNGGRPLFLKIIVVGRWFEWVTKERNEKYENKKKKKEIKLMIINGTYQSVSWAQIEI